MTVHARRIGEYAVAGRRLGRHIEHDPRSRGYPVRAAMPAGGLRKVRHRRYGQVLDQGDVGSCTGNAAAGALNTLPLHRRGGRLLREQDAVDLYAAATQVDEFEGGYPPDDTGSSGLAVAKAAKQKGLISGYRHAFSVEDALAALMFAPLITGVDWYESFDTPDPQGLVKVGGQVRGGHEFEVLGFAPGRSLEEGVVEAANSWGPDWGFRGRFRFTVATWRALLAAEGDATVLEVA